MKSFTEGQNLGCLGWACVCPLRNLFAAIEGLRYWFASQQLVKHSQACFKRSDEAWLKRAKRCMHRFKRCDEADSLKRMEAWLSERRSVKEAYLSVKRICACASPLRPASSMLGKHASCLASLKHALC